MPVLGWQIPVPPWNTFGLGIVVLGLLHFGRSLGVVYCSWGIRMLLPFAAAGWWASPGRFLAWGKSILAPVQLQLSGLNQGLATLGAEPIVLFDPVQWREASLSWGWKYAGLVLLLATVLTALDWQPRRFCSACKAKVSHQDRCCHQCGTPFPEASGCLGCGSKPQKLDKFCRTCGRSLV